MIFQTEMKTQKNSVGNITKRKQIRIATYFIS